MVADGRRWWLVPGEVLRSGGLTLVFDYDDPNVDLWGFRLGSRWVLWSPRQGGFAPSEINAEEKTLLRPALVAAAELFRNDEPGRATLEVMAQRQAERCTVSGRRIRQCLRAQFGNDTPSTADELERWMTSLMPRLVARAPAPPGQNAYQLTLAGLELVRPTFAEKAVAAILSVFRRHYESDPDDFETCTLQEIVEAGGFGPADSALLYGVVTGADLSAGGTLTYDDNHSPIPETTTLAPPADVEQLVGVSTLSELWKYLKAGNLWRPWPTAPQRQGPPVAAGPPPTPIPAPANTSPFIPAPAPAPVAIDAFGVGHHDRRLAVEDGAGAVLRHDPKKRSRTHSMRTKIFLNHSSADGSVAKAIVDLLERSLVVPDEAIRV